MNQSREVFRSRDINVNDSYNFKPNINEKSKEIASGKLS